MGTGDSANRTDSTSDSYFHAIIDHVPVACFLYDKDFNPIDCNRHALTMFGNDTKEEQNLGNLDESFPKHQPNGELSLEVVGKNTMIAFEEGFVKFPMVFNSRTGRLISCEVTMIRVEHQGEPAFLIYLRETAEDFSFTKQAKVERQRFKAMIDTSPVICAIFEKSFDVEGDYNILETNQAAADLFGLSDRRVYIERFYDLCPEYQPDGTLSRDKKLKMLKQAFEAGQMQFDWMHQTLEGVPVPCEVRLKRVQLSEAEVVIAYVRDLRDVIKYSEINERMRLMADATPLIVEYWDTDFNIIDCNQTALNYYNCSTKSEYLEKIRDNFYSWDSLHDLLDLAFKSGTAKVAIEDMQPDGSVIHFAVDAVRVKHNNAFVVVTYAQDITPLYMDPLTGVSNRRSFSSQLDIEWARSIRNSTSLSLIIADIDNFKQYNDSYGHPQGDVALKTVAKIMSDCVTRKTDMVARWGGEEFVVMLPEIDAESAVKIAEKIRIGVEEAVITAANGDNHKVTISLGVNTIIPSQNSKIEIFVSEADEALYVAKRSGKNRTKHSAGDDGR